MQKLKKGDSVIVLAGKDRGKTGKILNILPKQQKILVSGVNVIVKHLKPSKESEGKIVKQESPLHISNVSYYTKDKNISKIGFRFENEKKVRFLKKTGQVI
ncbi:MAG: 50S ribosomal protein L24 [Rickettsia sp.]|nr:50S ribosomal protein L24 [Rickettsia sp.]